MKKIMMIVVLLGWLSWTFAPVYAEEIGAGSYFETNVMPYLAAGGTSIVGALAVVVSSMRKAKQTATETADKIKAEAAEMKAQFDNGVKLLKDGTAKLTQTQAQMESGIKGVGEDVKSFTTSATKSITDMGAIVKAQKEEIAALKGTITSIQTDQTKTLQTILIGFGNNAELVKNGYAAQIASIAKGVTSEETTETINP
jgi:hypothetical protein